MGDLLVFNKMYGQDIGRAERDFLRIFDSAREVSGNDLRIVQGWPKGNYYGDVVISPMKHFGFVVSKPFVTHFHVFLSEVYSSRNEYGIHFWVWDLKGRKKEKRRISGLIEKLTGGASGWEQRDYDSDKIRKSYN